MERVAINDIAAHRTVPGRMDIAATLEGERLSRLLNDAPIVTSEGRMYPVTTIWGKPQQLGDYIEPRVIATCLDALEEQSGSVLIFLPGQAEIRRVHQGLQDNLQQRQDIGAHLGNRVFGPVAWEQFEQQRSAQCRQVVQERRWRVGVGHGQWVYNEGSASADQTILHQPTHEARQQGHPKSR